MKKHSPEIRVLPEDVANGIAEREAGNGHGMSEQGAMRKPRRCGRAENPATAGGTILL